MRKVYIIHVIRLLYSYAVFCISLRYITCQSDIFLLALFSTIVYACECRKHIAILIVCLFVFEIKLFHSFIHSLIFTHFK